MRAVVLVAGLTGDEAELGVVAAEVEGLHAFVLQLGDEGGVVLLAGVEFAS